MLADTYRSNSSDAHTAWPDFAWQRLSQGPSVWNYHENPNIDSALISATILPATLDVPAPGNMISNEYTAAGRPKDISDNNATGVCSSLTIGTLNTWSLDLSWRCLRD